MTTKKARNNRERTRVQVDASGPSRTQQHLGQETNINVLWKRYLGQQPVRAYDPNAAQFGDFSNGADFTAMNNRVVEARQHFAELPSAIRAHFENDPARLLDWSERYELGEVSDEELAALGKLGLRFVEDDQVVDPSTGEVTNPGRAAEPEPQTPNTPEESEQARAAHMSSPPQKAPQEP